MQALFYTYINIFSTSLVMFLIKTFRFNLKFSISEIYFNLNLIHFNRTSTLFKLNFSKMSIVYQ